MKGKELVHIYPNKVNSQEILVSVIVQTYNHEQFIVKCLDSLLMQNTNFPYEILLSEDDSSDETRKICIEYAEKYPETIRLFLHDRRNNIKINGNATGRYCLLWNLKHSKGKYIALCEGDDYWTDPLKLQKQVDFLEVNPKYVLCFHKVRILTIEDGIVDDFITEKKYDKIEQFPITQHTLFKHSNFIHTPSVVFRNVLKEFPVELQLSPVGDYLLYFILSKHGFMHRIDEVMGIYRYGQGVYSKLSAKEKNIIGRQFQICLLSYTDSDEIKKDIIKNMYIKVKSSENNNIQNYTVKGLFKVLFKRIVGWLKR
ncbi:glycosyltransferase family 2 protein [Bizionia sp. KMM 8389]